jgi:hypothetical protein
VGGLFYGLAIYTIITDVTIIVLPIPLPMIVEPVATEW